MTFVLNRLFPPTIDNTYRGNRIALWVFWLLTAVTLWRSWHHLTAPDGGAQSIATIPLDTYPEGAAMTIVSIFALWGLSQLLIGCLYLLTLLRYRSLIPVFYLLLILEYAVRALIMMNKSAETAGTAPGAVMNLPFVAVGVVMLVLSLRQRAE